MVVTRIAELPLPERDALELLALERDRIAPDHDYAGFGWCRVPRVELSAPDRPARIVAPAVLVAVHSADEQPDPHDIELLFELEDASITVPLSRWLPHALARVPADAGEVVLVLCNPAELPVRRPEGAAPLHYALGDVTSWLDRDADGSDRLRLSARRWKLAA